MPYPDHDDVHQPVDALLDTVSQAWNQHARTGQELDWPQFHHDTAALLACINEHGREHLQFLMETLPRDPGGPPQTGGGRPRTPPSPCHRAHPAAPARPVPSNRRGTP